MKNVAKKETADAPRAASINMGSVGAAGNITARVGTNLPLGAPLCKHRIRTEGVDGAAKSPVRARMALILLLIIYEAR